jgi:hypothetical protein
LKLTRWSRRPIHKNRRFAGDSTNCTFDDAFIISSICKCCISDVQYATINSLKYTAKNTGITLEKFGKIFKPMKNGTTIMTTT